MQLLYRYTPIIQRTSIIMLVQFKRAHDLNPTLYSDWVSDREALGDTVFIVFGMTRPGIEPPTSRSRGRDTLSARSLGWYEEGQIPTLSFGGIQEVRNKTALKPVEFALRGCPYGIVRRDQRYAVTCIVIARSAPSARLIKLRQTEIIQPLGTWDR